MEKCEVMDVVTAIIQRNLSAAKVSIQESLNKLAAEKLESLRKNIAEKVYGPMAEANVMRQGRTLLIRRRIRKGKLQRNIRKSAVKGFTLRKGKLKRIPVAKRIRARIVQRRAARKRRAHLQQTLRKRKLSIRKRKAMGIKEQLCHTN